MQQNTYGTKYKWNDIQIEQNKKVPEYKEDNMTKYKRDKIQEDKIQTWQNTK